MSKPKSMRKSYSTALGEDYPEEIKIQIGDHETVYRKKMSLRYGENPHQPAAYYAPTTGHLTVGDLEIVKTGKGGLSMTNVEDVNNSLRIVSYFDEPAVAVMKHVNPSGVAARNSPDERLKETYAKARDCDALAAFGSVVGFNTVVDVATAEEIMNSYVEGVVAPGYEEGCMEYFDQKKNIRIMKASGLDKISKWVGDPLEPLDISVQMDGSIVLQAPMLTKIKGPEGLRLVTEREATPQEIKDLLFSWYVCMNVRSNGVVLSKNNATIGVGTGQQDRVTAVKLAIDKASKRGHEDEIAGSVLASDGFFPFSDSIELLTEHGITACIQPGGSVRDKSVIKACNDAGIAMAFTDERCFRHF
ncbi:MAG: IMP cyclohydrolase [Candidatus Bathyarchaeota archaeon]|nr:IMP cyclohydrolase [Candidatus Bathyarchaeota archaeon]